MARVYPSIHEGTIRPFPSGFHGGADVAWSTPPLTSAHEVQAIEVLVAWGDSVIATLHHLPPRAVTLGEVDAFGRDCDVLLPKEKLGFDFLALIELERGTVFVNLPAGAPGMLEEACGHRTSLERIRLEQRSPNGIGWTIRYPLKHLERITCRLGLFNISVRAFTPIERQKVSLVQAVDREFLGAVGLVMLAVGAWMGAMAYWVPPVGLLDETAFDEDQLRTIQQYLKANAERNVSLDSNASENEPNQGERSGNAGSSSPGEAGKVGSTVAQRTGRRLGISGPEGNPNPHLGRSELIEQARQFGMVELLGVLNLQANHGISSPWGQGLASGRDSVSAMGDLYGREIGDSAGFGGISLSGTGQGGGCVGPNCGAGIGLGDVGTIGGGTGTCAEGETNCGMGRGGGHLGSGRHRERVPRMRPDGKTTVSGRLPAEVIQRIVRQNYGRFRYCYEQALARNPSLEGRVVTRFIIGRDGIVSHASPGGGSDLPDASVQGCIVQNFYGLSFPAPEGGVVTVSYPLYLQPG